MMSFKQPLLAASALVLALSQGAWTVGPTYHPPVQPPVTLAAPSPRLSAKPAEPAWWRAFGDPELDSLIERGLAANLDVAVALERVKETRALFHRSRFDLFPHVTTDGAYSRSHEQQPGFTSSPVDIEQADIGFDATWEIDIFGRVRHQVESARADAD
ncbi:MAG TPA: TolC family protein, partial [Caulobacteraceae bacterium]|nr:TolC family protein [Caulobacteraceae bacterium]